MPPRYKVKDKKYCFDPARTEPFRISRSKIDLFVECPRCFYLDQRLGVGRPSWPAFTLNNAVDELLKKEFDAYRAAGEAHPLMKENRVDAVPFNDDRMEAWRDSLRRGVQYHDMEHNFILRGGVDDVWVTSRNELIVVDYKATSKKDGVSIDGYWQEAYKRQMEVYQWLLRKNDFTVSDTGYFVYVNGKTDREAFGGKLDFDVTLIPYTGDDTWIPKTIECIHACLMGEEIPKPGNRCEYCPYREAAGKSLFEIHKTKVAEKKKIRPHVNSQEASLF